MEYCGVFMGVSKSWMCNDMIIDIIAEFHEFWQAKHKFIQKVAKKTFLCKNFHFIYINNKI